jgi:ribonuclease VapC
VSKRVFDASAILCLLQSEPGAEKLTDEIQDSAVASTVNLAEVQAKLVLKGDDPETAWQAALSTISEVELLTAEQAKLSGTLVMSTAKFGLSLGDRACLALAISLNAEVYTTEKLWKNLDIGVPIHVIR